MPIYDFKCKKCNIIYKDIFTKSWKENFKCSNCGKNTEKMIAGKMVSAKVFPVEGVFLEHVSAEGKLFKSTKEMRKYERDNDVELGYLL